MITTVSLAVRLSQYADIARQGATDSDASFPLLAGAFAGIVIGAFFGWQRSAPLDNVSQRGVIGVLSAVGALLVAFILSVLADYLLGLWGVAALALVSFAFGFAGGRWATRGAGDPEPGQRDTGNA